MYPQRSWNVGRFRPPSVNYSQTNFFNSRAPNIACYWTLPNEQSYPPLGVSGGQYPVRGLLDIPFSYGGVPVNRQQAPLTQFPRWSHNFPKHFERRAVNVSRGRSSESGLSSGTRHRQQCDHRSSVENISLKILDVHGASCAASVVATPKSSDLPASASAARSVDSESRFMLLSTTSTTSCSNSVKTNHKASIKLPVSDNTRSSKETVTTTSSSVLVSNSKSTVTATPPISIEVCNEETLSADRSVSASNGENTVTAISSVSVQVFSGERVMSDSSSPINVDSSDAISCGSSSRSSTSISSCSDVVIVNHVDVVEPTSPSPTNESEFDVLSSDSYCSERRIYNSSGCSSVESNKQVSTPSGKCKEDAAADSSRCVVIDDGGIDASSDDGSSSLCRVEDEESPSLGKHCSGTSRSDVSSETAEHQSAKSPSNSLSSRLSNVSKAARVRVADQVLKDTTESPYNEDFQSVKIQGHSCVEYVISSGFCQKPAVNFSDNFLGEVIAPNGEKLVDLSTASGTRETLLSSTSQSEKMKGVLAEDRQIGRETFCNFLSTDTDCENLLETCDEVNTECQKASYSIHNHEGVDTVQLTVNDESCYFNVTTTSKASVEGMRSTCSSVAVDDCHSLGEHVGVAGLAAKHDKVPAPTVEHVDSSHQSVDSVCITDTCVDPLVVCSVGAQHLNITDTSADKLATFTCETTPSMSCEMTMCIDSQLARGERSSKITSPVDSVDYVPELTDSLANEVERTDGVGFVAEPTADSSLQSVTPTDVAHETSVAAAHPSATECEVTEETVESSEMICSSDVVCSITVEVHEQAEETMETTQLYNFNEEDCEPAAVTNMSAMDNSTISDQSEQVRECKAMECFVNAELTLNTSLPGESSSTAGTSDLVVDSLHTARVSDHEVCLTARLSSDTCGDTDISILTSFDIPASASGEVLAELAGYRPNDNSTKSHKSPSKATASEEKSSTDGESVSSEVKVKTPFHLKILPSQRDKLRKALQSAGTLGSTESNSKDVEDGLRGVSTESVTDCVVESTTDDQEDTLLQHFTDDREDSADTDDLPAVSAFLGASSVSGVKKSTVSSTLTLDDILHEKRQRAQEKQQDRQEELQEKKQQEVTPPNRHCDSVKPEHQQILDKISVTTCDLPDIHPGEQLFNSGQYLSLFSYPETLSLAACGFTAGTSRTDKQLASLSGDLLLKFLNPGFISLVFKAISRPQAFSSWIFYMISINEDADVRSRLQRILHNVIHGTACDWVPTVQSVCRVLVNYGSTLSQLCSNQIVVSFTQDELKLTQESVNGHHNDITNGTSMETECDDSSKDCNGFRVENLMAVIQIVTDAIAVRPERYSNDDCLALTFIMLRVGLDPQLAYGQAQLSFELFFAAVINAVPNEQWTSWVSRLCDLLPALTTHHHNMVYLIDLLPLVERGVYLRKVLSIVFIGQLLKYTTDNVLEAKVKTSLALLRALPIALDDYYFALSVTKLLGYSIGSENVMESEKEDFKNLINLLHYRISKLSHLALDVSQSVYRTQAVMIATRWEFMYRRLPTDTMFSSPMKLGHVTKEKVGPDTDALSDISDD